MKKDKQLQKAQDDKRFEMWFDQPEAAVQRELDNAQRSNQKDLIEFYQSVLDAQNDQACMGIVNNPSIEQRAFDKKQFEMWMKQPIDDVRHELDCATSAKMPDLIEFYQSVLKAKQPKQKDDMQQ